MILSLVFGRFVLFWVSVIYNRQLFNDADEFVYKERKAKTRLTSKTNVQQQPQKSIHGCLCRASSRITYFHLLCQYPLIAFALFCLRCQLFIFRVNYQGLPTIDYSFVVISPVLWDPCCAWNTSIFLICLFGSIKQLGNRFIHTVLLACLFCFDHSHTTLLLSMI